MPSRINSLMRSKTTALLIYTATEYLMRRKMKKHKLTITAPDHRTQLEKPCFMRLYQYISNSVIVLQCDRSSGTVTVHGLPTEFKLILIAMGDEWCRYYLKSYYLIKHFKLLTRRSRMCLFKIFTDRRYFTLSLIYAFKSHFSLFLIHTFLLRFIREHEGGE